MARPSTKLAESLGVLSALQEQGFFAIRSGDLTRTHRERLLKSGFLHEVMKGWYIPARPEEAAGQTTTWYAAFWHFCATYLHRRKGHDWCLSAEQSIALHVGNWTVPQQLVVRAAKARNHITNLPHDTALLDVRATLPDEADVVEVEGLRLYTLPAALVACAPGCFVRHPIDLRAALGMIQDASEVLGRLLDHGHSTIAGRLVGAFRNIGRTRIADDIAAAMGAAGYVVREHDPFDDQQLPLSPARPLPPVVTRIRLLWRAMRSMVVERFARPPRRRMVAADYLQQIEEAYVADAYHSLSIEGYQVSEALIARVAGGRWNPDDSAVDRDQRNALAARGYWQAYQAVRGSVARVLQGDDPGAVAEQDHRAWYRELFAPSVTAGLLTAGDLAGYRDGPVYLRGSMHVPPRCEAVRDAMPALFDLLAEETEPAVRAVLGHFLFVYIHPYPDGNGRMGRFLMNVMLAAGGYRWTVIPVQERGGYLAALEAASVRQDIAPFTRFLDRLVAHGGAAHEPRRR